MSKGTKFLAIFTGSILICLPALSQTEEHRSEVSAQLLGAFVHGTDQNGIRQTTSDSAGILASYRFFFSAHQGLEGNYAYSRSTTRYALALTPSGVTANQHEWTGAYVFRFPTRWISPYLEAGVGGLTFSPTFSNSPGASSQTRPAFLYGAGADLNLGSRIFIRAQYRGFVYSSPDFAVAANLGNDRVTHLFEPSVGLGVRF
jgi:opacity protein-like surface antigen